MRKAAAAILELMAAKPALAQLADRRSGRRSSRRVVARYREILIPALEGLWDRAGEPRAAHTDPAPGLRPGPGADLQPDRRRPHRASSRTCCPTSSTSRLLPFAGHEEALEQARLAADDDTPTARSAVTDSDERPAQVAAAARPPRPPARAGHPLPARAPAGRGGAGHRRQGLRSRPPSPTSSKRPGSAGRASTSCSKTRSDCLLAARAILVDDLEATVSDRLRRSPGPGRTGSANALAAMLELVRRRPRRGAG